MLMQRVITASTLAIVFAGAILFADHKWVVLLFAVALFAASRELITLTIKPGAIPGVVIAAGVASLFWYSNEFADTRVIYYQSVAGLMLWVTIFGYLLYYRFSGQWSLVQRIWQFFLGTTLLWICVHGLAFIHQDFSQGG